MDLFFKRSFIVLSIRCGLIRLAVKIVRNEELGAGCMVELEAHKATSSARATMLVSFCLAGATRNCLLVAGQ